MRLATIAAVAVLLTGCSGETEQAGNAESDQNFASAPLPSPDVDGAIWEMMPQGETIRFGKSGNQPYFVIGCDGGTIKLTRNSPADEGAKALMALIGNGDISRIPVDATDTAGGSVWQGEFEADDDQLDVFLGERHVAVTVPGAGRLELAGSTMPGALITQCRADMPKAASPPAR